MKPAAAVPDAWSERPRSLSRPRLLLAEDVDINREILRAAVATLGISLDTAPDGQAAVTMAAAQDYDLILMDIQMPGLDGLTATRLIRQLADRRRAAVPIIALTGHHLASDQARCRDAGMNGQVGKPIDAARLVRLLAHWLPDHPWPGQPVNRSDGSAGPAAGQSGDLLAPLQQVRLLIAGHDPILSREILADLLVRPWPAKIADRLVRLDQALSGYHYVLAADLAADLAVTLKHP